MIELLNSYWSILFPLIVVVFLGFAFLMKVKYKFNGDFKNAHWYVVPFIAAVGLVFVILDWLLNIVMTLLYLDLPAKPFELTTGRMARYKYIIVTQAINGVLYNDMRLLNKFRFISGLKICEVLEELDPGHCSE